jgi:rare lipoprotein A
MHSYTAAHRSLPIGTVVRVVNLKNGRGVIVKINDRGPYIKGRIIDLSFAAAKSLEMVRSGIARVKVEVISAPI